MAYIEDQDYQEPDFDYDADTSIDPHNLHEEVFGHSNKYYKYCAHASAMERRLKKAKERVKIIRSQLIKEAKEKSVGTQMDIEAYYRDDPKHKEARADEIHIEYEYNMAMNAIYALAHKKHMLEHSVTLYTSQYFAVPKTPIDVGSGGKRISDYESGKIVDRERQALKEETDRRREKQTPQEGRKRGAPVKTERSKPKFQRN